jgi:hypothetical protein
MKVPRPFGVSPCSKRNSLVIQMCLCLATGQGNLSNNTKGWVWEHTGQQHEYEHEHHQHEYGHEQEHVKHSIFLNGVKHSVTSLIAEEYGKGDGEINTIRDTITKPDEREARITRTREQREKALEGA